MNPISPRERLYKVFAAPDGDVEGKIDRALEIGTDYFDLPVGFFTRVSDGTQKMVCVCGDHSLIQPGETCPLEDAYCRRTVEMDGLLAVQNASESPIDQRAIDVFGLGTYIGAKIVVDDDVYGTVCFADEARREHPFSETKELFLELLANLIGTALERRSYDQEIEGRNERLRQEKQRFRGIAENSFDILFRVGLDTQFTYVSSAVERILGYEPEELVGHPFTEFITEAAAEEAAPAYLLALDGDEVEELELDFLDHSGSTVVLEVNATPIFDAGETVGVQGVGRDITSRKEQERELRLKNRAMDEADLGISIVDPHQPDEPLIYVNNGFERVTGYSADDAVGRNCRFLQGPATDPQAITQFREAIEAEEATTVELINYRHDGTPFWNRVQLDPVFDDDGALLHYLGFQSDITERRRTEQLIELLNRVLRHNLRNDMNAISGWAGTIRHAEEEQIRDAGARIERLCRDLSTLSEHARELERYARYDHDPERLVPETLLRDVADTHRTRWPEAAFNVRIETERSICAGAELQEALVELLENAVKHNPGDESRVDVEIRDDDDWIETVVTDNGPGIDEFEGNVVTTGNETALEHGSGLGLWLVNWIVTRYGGSFQISARGPSGTQGTTATVRLPAIRENQPIAEIGRAPTVLFR